MKQLRRCREDRWDFTEDDGAAVFPVVAVKGGTQFGFCPGKASWYPDVNALYRLLTVIAETGAMPYAGGLLEQPTWIVDLMGWFIPWYKQIQFLKRAEMVFGKAEPKTTGAPPNADNRR